MPRKSGRPVKIETAHLPEFGLDVSWAMCRNPMCENFGVPFEGTIPGDRKQISDRRYTVRIIKGRHGEMTGEIQCRRCEQSSRLASNRAIRTIARHFLAMSLPYADCPDPECKSHGVNLYEHWTETGTGNTRHYRREWNHGAACRHCGSSISLGTPLGVKNPSEAKFDRPPKDETEEQKRERLAKEKRHRRETREIWRTIIQGARTQRSITNTIEISEIGTGTYYRHLARISGRLHDYHAFRNAGLLRPDIAERIEAYIRGSISGLRAEIRKIEARKVRKGKGRRKRRRRKRASIEARQRRIKMLRARLGQVGRQEPVCVYTDVLEVSIKAFREDRRYQFMKVIASAILVDNTIFAVAAHPFFLPRRLCPDRKAARPDRQLLDFEGEWSSLWHPHRSYPYLSTDKRLELIPQYGLNGHFIRSPYAEIAHFLVVQKMLDRFDNVHWYMDAAKEMFAAALVALRDRILWARPYPDCQPDGRERPARRAEIVLFQHDKKAQKKPGSMLDREEWVRERSGDKILSDAWKAAEKRFDGLEVPKDLLKEAVSKKNPRVRAHLYKRAFKGAYSKGENGGGWAWLSYPRETVAYRRCRSLWLTRMPEKTFRSHGKAALSRSTLQPVDSLFNSVRARTSAAGRPALRASGRGYRASYVMPSVVMDELIVYLLGRNYALRKKTTQKVIPARAFGLITDETAKLDMLEAAWGFRLGISHAKRISRWRRV